MRESLIRSLRAANRFAKGVLGIQVETAPPPAAPFFLDAVSRPPAYAVDALRGTCVFVLQYVTRGAGGLADVLYLGEQLGKMHGLDVRYHVVGGQSIEDCRAGIRWTLPSVRPEQVIERVDFVPEFLCATAWPTAYSVLTMSSKRKLYFVQDYEPWFHRAGVTRHYAEKTYALGLEMFTLGPWLAGHLSGAHGLSVAHAMPFPVTDPADPGKPLRERKVIAMYVQPDKEHRGTELMLEAARRISLGLADEESGLELVLFGSHENDYLKPDFPCTMRGVLAEAELLELFRNTRLGICASFTNVSLITFRFLAHGCMSLDLDLPGVAINTPPFTRPLMRLYEPSPESLRAACLSALSDCAGPRDQSEVANRLAAEHSWPSCAAALAPLFKNRVAAVDR